MDLQEIRNRKAKYEKKTRLGLIIIILSFVLYIPSAMAMGMQGAFVTGAFFLGGGIYSGVFHHQFKKLSIEFKQVYVKHQIQKIFPTSKYEPERGFDKQVVYATKIMRKADRFYSEDLLRGTYRDIPFESADVKLQEVHSNGKSTTVVTVFLGRLYRFHFPIWFWTELILIQPGLGQGWGFKDYHKMQTESVEFNREFLIYTLDELQAFRMLLPQFMEKLLELDQKYHDKIALHFVGNVLEVAINSNVDTLDLKMFKPIDDRLFQRFIEEIEDVKSILQILEMSTENGMESIGSKDVR